MEKESSVINCGCGVVVLAINFIIGGMSINYLLLFFLDKTIPFLGAALIGLFAGEITIPVAVVVWLLRAFGVL